MLRKMRFFFFVLMPSLGLRMSVAPDQEPMRKNGKAYGVVDGLFQYNWWNYCERALSFGDGGFWHAAELDLKEAIKQREDDQTRARTYGRHFIDYFPHRELGVAYYHQGKIETAIGELTTSLSTAESSKAKLYLDLVRTALIRQWHGLIENIMKDRKREAILKELDNNWDDLFLKLNELNEDKLNAVAKKLGMKDYAKPESHDLIENILKYRKREAILKELNNEIFLKLNLLDQVVLNVVAHDLGIKDYSQQDKPELIENIMKDRKREAILKALKVKRWPKILAEFFGILSGLASIIALLFYTDIGKDLKEWFYPDPVITTTTTTVIPARTTVLVPSDTTTSTVDTEPKECHDSLARKVAKKFYDSVKKAPPATYDENNLSLGLQKDVDMEYGGRLMRDKNGKLTGRMTFSHKESANTFTLDSDGTISPNEGDEWTDPVTGMEFVWVSGGCFKMGCEGQAAPCYPNQKPIHPVCVDGFWMGAREVTQGQWDKLTQKDPSEQNAVKGPAREISWDDAKAFVHKLNAHESTVGKFRLPTEAEWEYACRNMAGTSRLSGMEGGVQE